MTCYSRITVGWIRLPSVGILLVLGVLLLAGCVKSSQRGDAQLLVIWPQETRAATLRGHGAIGLVPFGKAVPLPSTVPLQPEATDADALLRMQSLAIEVYGDDRWIAGYTLNRTPGRYETLLSLNGVPVGDFTFTATAYPEKDGRGIRLGSCAGELSVEKGKTTRTTLTTVTVPEATLSILPKYPSVTVDEHIKLFAMLKNPDGSLVVVPNSTYRWTIGNAKLASIDMKDGEVWGKAPGRCKITLQDVRRNIDIEMSLDVMASYAPSR